MKDRVVSIAEIGGDRAVGGHRHAAADRCGTRGVGGVDPFAAAVGVPADQLERTLSDPVEPSVEEVVARPEDQVEAVVLGNVANVDLGRKRGKIFGGDLRRSPGGAERPVQPVAHAAADAHRSSSNGSGSRRRDRRYHRSRPFRDEVDGSHSLGRRHRHAGRATGGQRSNAERLPLLAPVRAEAAPVVESSPRPLRCTTARARPRSSSRACAIAAQASARRHDGRTSPGGRSLIEHGPVFAKQG